MGDRAVIHINVADFAVAVERLVDRRLRDRPVIVAPEATRRAVVYDMSEEAYCSGVRKQMPVQRALRCCPDAAVLPPHPDRYERAMNALLKHALPYSPRVEMTDHRGHLFIDATGTRRLFGPPPDVALRIRRAVQSELGIGPVWSVAANKLTAKAASRTVKPNGERIVSPGDEPVFLAPLPLHLIPGIEPEDLLRLRELNLSRAGQVARLSAAQLEAVFGIRGRSLYDAVRGIDLSPVLSVGEKPPTARAEHTFGGDSNDPQAVERGLFDIVERIGVDLRRRALTARRIGVFLDYSDGVQTARQAALQPASAADPRLFAAARTALHRAWTRRIRVRRLRVVCDRLTYPSAQLALFGAETDERRREDRLASALDAIRQRFGTDALRTGRTLAPRDKTP